MSARVKAWLEERRRADDQAVLDAIAMLRPDCAALYPIHRLAHLRVTRVMLALERLDAAGQITRSSGPSRWRYIYKLTSETTAASIPETRREAP